MPISDRRILIVEDNYLVACDIQQELEAGGAIVIGPEPSVTRALDRIAYGDPIDVAILDVNLVDGTVLPVAENLAARGLPFVFASG